MLQPPPEVKLQVGDCLEVMCDATGSQPLRYQWFKEATVVETPTGRKLVMKNPRFKESAMLETQTERKLVMKSVQPDNEGMYICRVSNIRGYQYSRWLRVVVDKEGEEEGEPQYAGFYKTDTEQVSIIQTDQHARTDRRTETSGMQTNIHDGQMRG